uniref:Multidrug resistance protein, MATE family n=1 Tax=Candidatus Kentrum sp. FM TaxID=2126340 RepID=A0A450TG96_9GAMM|nr:MAG: multidrug resistance protein, MATE family [Candidatus Kentron sp. FM]VFJ66226.1 MAG: multidrug resistance protein, MATE family [Candidatus Kentron sp. FM]VFK11788.1 MAG: multidrug resistance protein, MATE family [Candidatus Kentron sp. FM]
MIRQGLWVSGILFIPGAAILWHLEEILLLTGQLPELARMAGQYMAYFLWALFPELTTSVFLLAFTAMDRAGTGAIIMWFAVAINALLDYLLIFGNFGFPAMGMAGAGLASVIAYGSAHMIFFTLLSFYRFFSSATVFRRAWRPKRKMLGRILRLGWPKALEMALKSGLFSVLALLAGWFGVVAVAAHTIAFQVAMLAGMVIPVSIASAVTTRMGAADGRKDYSGMWTILNSGIFLLLLFILPPVVALKLFSPWIVMVFVGAELKAQALVSLAAPLVVLVAFFILVDSLRTVVGYALNGLSDMKVPTPIAGLAYWGIGLPAGMVLAFVMDLGVLGLWWGLTLGMTVAAVAYLARFRSLIRRFSSATETG